MSAYDRGQLVRLTSKISILAKRMADREGELERLRKQVVVDTETIKKQAASIVELKERVEMQDKEICTAKEMEAPVSAVKKVAKKVVKKTVKKVVKTAVKKA